MINGADPATARILIFQMYQHPFRPISREYRDKLLRELEERQ